jgi:tetratricopeptide (TPR) repeat protein
MRNHKKKIFALIAAFTAILFIAALTFMRKPSPPHQAESTRRMAERLKQIAQHLNPKTNSFASAERVKYLRTLNPPDPAGKLTVMHHLGEALLHNGQTEEAIAQFKQVLQQATGPYQYRARPNLVRQIRDNLALAYLRLGEQDNCIIQHSIESCLLPIKGNGIHTIQRGSRAAIEEYSALLNDYPNDLRCRWLLNIAYITLGEYPDQVPEIHGGHRSSRGCRASS